MSCCNTGKITKKKIIVFSVIGIAIVATYFVFTATNSSAALALPAILGFAACPAMCVAMGGVMWIAARFGSNKKQNNSEKTSPEHLSCCDSYHAYEHNNENLKST